MKRTASAVWALVLSALVAGCVHHPGADLFGDARRPIRFDVRNLNFNDANVWAVFRAERVRLGTVIGKSEGSFRLPWKGTEPVYMEIDLVGGVRCTTDALTADEGDVFYLEIELEPSAMPECARG